MPSTLDRAGAVGEILRATTVGMDSGFTIEALPIRVKREPGWMTMTREPRLHEHSEMSIARGRVIQASKHVAYRGSGDATATGSSAAAFDFLDAFLAQIVWESVLR
jgi:hypothetical protein